MSVVLTLLVAVPASVAQAPTGQWSHPLDITRPSDSEVGDGALDDVVDRQGDDRQIVATGAKGGDSHQKTGKSGTDPADEERREEGEWRTDGDQREDEALEQYAEAARLAPEDPRPFYLIGKAWLKQNQSGKAVAAFRQGLRLDPNDVQTLTYLARVLASDSDGRVRNGAEAVTLAVRANELTGGDQPFVLDVLAMAYAEAGQFDQARETTRKAIEIASQTGDSVRTPEMEQRLMLYQSNQPYRAPASNDGLEPVRAR